MRRKGVYGRIFAIILAATMVLGTVPETALMVQAEGIESEQINEEETDDQGDEGNAETDTSEGEGAGDENQPENEGSLKDENQPENECGLEDENQPGDDEGSKEGSEDADADGEDEEEIGDESIIVEEETYGTDSEEDCLEINNGIITGFKEGKDQATLEIIIDKLNVSKIADQAFKNNKTIESVCIYVNSLSYDEPFEIGAEAFAGCTNLSFYTSSVAIDSIGARAFEGTKLGDDGILNIQAKKIGNYAFSNLTGERFTVSLSPTLNELGEGAFANNTGLVGIDLLILTHPVVTHSIAAAQGGNGPFSGCANLRTVKLGGYDGDKDPATGENTIVIPEGLFAGCTGLKNVTLDIDNSTSVSSIEAYAFKGCTSLTSIEFLKGTGVRSIGRAAFYNSGLTGTATIPDSVTEIGMEAFNNIATLAGVQLSANLQKIDSGAFAKTGLTSVTIPKTVNSVGHYNDESGNGPFADTKNLATVAFEDGMTAIPANIFKGSSITTVTIPSSVTRIEKYAFTNCSNLTSVSLPDNLTYIGRKAFCESGLTGTVTIPDSVTEIGDEAFYNIATLTGVGLSERLQTIGSGAFAKTGLTSVTIPKYVKTVGRYSAQDGNGPFWGANSLTTAAFEDGMTAIPNNIFKGSSIDTVTIPNSVNRIEEYAFTNCRNLTSVSLPSKLTYIGRKAFYGSGLTGTVQIPFAVTEIVDLAFGDCSNLEFLEFGTKVNKLGSWIWDGCSLVKLKVIKGSTTEKTLKNKGYGSLIQYYSGPKYSITYELNGGTNSSYNPDIYSWSCALTLKNPKKTGYTFKGWYTSDTYKTKVTTIAKGSTGNKTLYAKWAKNKYTVQFSANGGTGTTKSMSCYYDGTYNLRANKYTRKGYTFVGWAKSKKGEVVYTNGAPIENLTAKSNGTVTLYAKWKKINYTITYNNLEGATNESNPATYTVTNTVTLKKAYKEGYTFNGWYKDAKFKKKVTTISKGTTGNKTFYAKFTANKYYVSFNVKGEKSTLSGTYHDGVELPGVEESFDPGDGTTFAGWNTKEDGTGTHYDAGDSMAVFAKPGKKATKITLYAEWQ